VTTSEPPPPPPPPPAGYRTAHGLPAQAPATPPARPEIDPSLLRPSKAWYWVAGAIGVIALVASTAISVFNTFDNFGNEEPGLSLLSWLLYFTGGGIAAAIGGFTWSRRNEHKRRLQHDEMVRQGLI
jgi:hypothetical protein